MKKTFEEKEMELINKYKDEILELYLNKIYFPKSYDLASITSLLNSYSMINSHGKEDVYTIHRLVQQVIRINLEQNQPKFKTAVYLHFM